MVLQIIDSKLIPSSHYINSSPWENRNRLFHGAKFLCLSLFILWQSGCDSVKNFPKTVIQMALYPIDETRSLLSKVSFRLLFLAINTMVAVFGILEPQIYFDWEKIILNAIDFQKVDEEKRWGIAKRVLEKISTNKELSSPFHLESMFYLIDRLQLGEVKKIGVGEQREFFQSIGRIFAEPIFSHTKNSLRENNPGDLLKGWKREHCYYLITGCTQSTIYRKRDEYREIVKHLFNVCGIKELAPDGTFTLVLNHPCSCTPR